MPAAANPYNAYTTDPLWFSVWTLCLLVAIGLFFLSRAILKRRIAASDDPESWLARLGRIDPTSTPRKAGRRLFFAVAVAEVILIFGGRQPHLLLAGLVLVSGGAIIAALLARALNAEAAGRPTG